MSRAPEPPEIPSQPRLDEVELVFAALAHATRRQIVLMLAHLGGELPSGYLATRLAASWPTTTRHLHVLEAAGLVEVRREGRGSYYRLDRERVRRVLGTWLALLEPPTPARTWRSSGPTSVLARASIPAPPKGKGKRS